MSSLPLTPVPADPHRLACCPGERFADDASLLAALLEDDGAAWREFNLRYARLIQRCILRVTSRFPRLLGPEDVEEIYATLCVQLLARDKHKLRSFEPERGHKLSGWLGMLAVNATYDYLRGLKREPRHTQLDEAVVLSSNSPDPSEDYLMRQRAHIVSSLLEGFSEKDREFITLYYGEGLEPDQIAERMSISVKTVYSKKHKIRERLGALLSQRQLAA